MPKPYELMCNALQNAALAAQELLNLGNPLLPPEAVEIAELLEVIDNLLRGL